MMERQILVGDFRHRILNFFSNQSTAFLEQSGFLHSVFSLVNPDEIKMHTSNSEYEIIPSQKYEFRLCWSEWYSQAFLNAIVICKCSQTLQKKKCCGLSANVHFDKLLSVTGIGLVTQCILCSLTG